MSPTRRLFRANLIVSFVATLSACQNYNLTRSENKPSVDGAAQLGAARGPTDPRPSYIETDAAAAPAESDPPGEAKLEYERNSTVGRYLWESEKLCGDYLQDLTRNQRGYSLILGSLSTIFGAAGAAFTNASVVRPLSALASIASGERAEVDADMFAKQTSQVIVSAIKNSRARAYNAIVQVDFGKSMQAWPLSVALADVQNYHSRCSLNEGITEAAASISAASVTAPQKQVDAGAPNSPPAPRTVAPPSEQATKATAAAIAATGAAQTLAKTGANAQTVANAVTGALTAGGDQNTNAPALLAPLPVANLALSSKSSPLNVSSVASVARIQVALAKFQRDLVRQHKLPLAGDGASTIVVDGILGNATAGAIRLFQGMSALQPTGNPDSATLSKLGVANVGMPNASLSGLAEIKAAQNRLVHAQLAYPISLHLPVSGVIDAPTIGALVAYQDTMGLPLTGVLDIPTYAALMNQGTDSQYGNRKK